MKPGKQIPKSLFRKLAEWPVRQVARVNYDVDKAYYHYLLRRPFVASDYPPLLIYQMGKVGSSSVSKSLEALDLGMPIYHVHFLTREHIDLYEEKRRKLFGTPQRAELRHIWQYSFLLDELEKASPEKKWRVITLVREPISRNLSAFFETLHAEPIGDERYRLTADTKAPYEFDITIGLDEIDKLIDVFLEVFEHDVPLKFFDDQLKTVLGVDVFAEEFPKTAGYKIYQGEKADVLVLKLEKLADCAPQAIKEFLGIDDFTLTSKNIGSEKAYAPIYKQLQDSIVFADDYINTMYDSRYARQFYTDEEIDRFKQRWRKNR